MTLMEFATGTVLFSNQDVMGRFADHDRQISMCLGGHDGLSSDSAQYAPQMVLSPSVMSQRDDADGGGSPVERPEVVDTLDRRPSKKHNVKRVRKRGNIEDIPLGLICHNCRQKSIDDHVTCSRCPLRFCGRCLLNRHGEKIELELRENVRWVCPRCRGGCGPGCYKTCCNCGPCRKAQNLQPTGQLVRTARDAGFSNVHDYLVHLETGESPAAIDSRKNGRGWTSTDSSPRIEVVALDTRRQGNALTMTEKGRTKKRRSYRFFIANSNWGSRTIPGYNEREVHEKRLWVASLHSTWDVERKLKRKWPSFSTEGQIFTPKNNLGVRAKPPERVPRFPTSAKLGLDSGDWTSAHEETHDREA